MVEVRNFDFKNCVIRCAQFFERDAIIPYELESAAQNYFMAIEIGRVIEDIGNCAR
jgi:hypothetical protein